MSDEPRAPTMRTIRKRQGATPETPPAESDRQQPAPAKGVRLNVANRSTALFLGCLAVGLLLATASLSDNAFMQSVGLLGPVAATVAFPFLGIAAGLASDSQTRERFADNCYYLGFIFTQAALLFGFLPVAIYSRDISSSDVLRFFGVAIGASMAGLIARTLLVQTARTTSELDNVIHNEVEALAVAVSDRSRRVFEQFNALGQDLSAAQGALNRQLQDQVALVAGSMREYETLLRREVDILASGSARVAAAADRAEQHFDRHQRSFGQEVQRAADLLEKLHADLSGHVEGATAAIRGSAQSLAVGAEALSGLSGLGGSVEALRARMAHIDAATEVLDGSVRQASQLIEKTSSAVTMEMTGAADRAGEALDTAVGDAAGRLAASFDQSSGQLELSARQARASFDSQAAGFSNDLQGAVASLRETLAAFREEIERLRVEPGEPVGRSGRSRRGKGRDGE